MTTTPPRHRTGRTTAAALVVAGFIALLLHQAAPALAAPWVGTTTVSTTASMARLGSSFQGAIGSGTVSTDRSRYALSGLLTTATGYVDLVNTSDVPVTLSLTLTMGTLVGNTPATACSVPWNTALGTCPGTTTVVGTTTLAANQTITYSTPTQVPAGGALRLQVQCAGVANVVTLTTRPVVPRTTGLDRTTS